MKLGSIIACLVPELRRMTGAQLLEVWSACTPYSRLKIYVHIILLLACCSLIFNLAMWLRGPFIVDLLGLVIGLTVPVNIYFYNVFNPRRAEVRRFVEEHWDEFNK
jgi:hypothetical protein